MIKTAPLFPVILPVSAPADASGGERVAHQRKSAREALKISARHSRVKLPDILQKNRKGAPIPFDGNYWSISHKPKLAAAVIGRQAIGIDIEEIKPRSEAVWKKVISKAEQALAGKQGSENDFFFRVWTAKEAVLKAEGIGLAGLSGCRVVGIPDKSSMLLDFEHRLYRVNQIFFQNHWASLVICDLEAQWIFRDCNLTRSIHKLG
ncbi:MAG: 4'-phosphopantetheinyl transferase family protein [bacterium]